jgi:hypothetical protein
MSQPLDNVSYVNSTRFSFNSIQTAFIEQLKGYLDLNDTPLDILILKDDNYSAIKVDKFPTIIFSTLSLYDIANYIDIYFILNEKKQKLKTYLILSLDKDFFHDEYYYEEKSGKIFKKIFDFLELNSIFQLLFFNENKKKQIEVEKKQVEDNIEQYQKQIIEQNDLYKSILERENKIKDIIPIELRKEQFQKLKSLPILNFSIYKSTMSFVSSPTIFHYDFSDNIKELETGRYKFDINLSLKYITVSYYEHTGKYDFRPTVFIRHPHVTERGLPCFGQITDYAKFLELKEEIDKIEDKKTQLEKIEYLNQNPPMMDLKEYFFKLIDDEQYFSAISLLLTWVKSYYITDAYLHLEDMLEIPELKKCTICGSKEHYKEKCKSAVRCQHCRSLVHKNELSAHIEEYHTTEEIIEDLT